ncbi:MAG TPA: hypothetical protein VEZ88_03285 [Steroidobacteraceae bacterium]|nr:hypothetical protein [Steroidobacteraceae bacterium]
MNKGRIRHVLVATATTLVLGAGLVLAQTSGRSDLSGRPTTLERHPLWVPGGEVPMAAYLQSERDSLPAPPR